MHAMRILPIYLLLSTFCACSNAGSTDEELTDKGFANTFFKRLRGSKTATMLEEVETETEIEEEIKPIIASKRDTYLGRNTVWKLSQRYELP
jgi:hypothetical protein